MKLSAFALVIASSAAAVAPALAQLRATPQLSFGRSAQAAGAPDATPRQADYIVAVVNSEPITNTEVRNRLLRAEQQLAQQGAVMPPREELTRQVLERIISERAQLQLARETGIRVDEAAVDQAEATVARQNQFDVAELRRRLVADGFSLTTFRQDLRNQLLLGRLRDREIEPRVRVSDLELDQFILEQQSINTDPVNLELNLAQVLVAVPENASEAEVARLRARAQQVLERARAGADFAALAREFSDAPGATTTGGEFGLRSADRYPGLFLQATQTLREGGLSDVLRSGAGFHVLKVLQKRQAGLPGATVTQSRARHILLRPGPQLNETDARARLADFRRRLLAGQADFAQLAREASQDASAEKGGDLGWAVPGTFVPEFEETMNRLAPGEVSEPLVSRFGVHLIQLVERRQAELSEREQRELARNLLREKKLDEAYQQWAQEVRGRAFVEFREPPQ